MIHTIFLLRWLNLAGDLAAVCAVSPLMMPAIGADLTQMHAFGQYA
jgi:hypothetical protein